MKSHLRIWLLLFSFSLIPCQLFSQNKAEISVGAGFPDFLNLKFKYGKEIQIYGGAGFLPAPSIWSYTAGLDLHFPLKPKNDKTRKLYLNNGAANMSPGKLTTGDSDNLFILYSRIGISVYNSGKNDRSGIDFDLGIMFEAGPETKSINRPPAGGRPTTIQVKRERIVFPAASLSYFFKL